MSRFAALPAHVETHLGRVLGADSRQTDQRLRDYHLVHCRQPDGAHVSVLSSGLRDELCGAPLPQEVLCTMRSEQQRYARHLTGVVAELLADGGSRLGYGALITNDRLLLPETEIAGALAAPHPYLGEEFDVLLDEAGAPALQLVTLIPVSRGEAQLVARRGRDALYDRWQERQVDLRDVHRSAAA